MFPLAPFEKDLKIFNVKTKKCSPKKFLKKIANFQKIFIWGTKKGAQMYTFSQETHS